MMAETGQLLARYVDALLGGRRGEAIRLVIEEGRAAGLSSGQLLQLVRDGQHEIGRLWEENRISIADEHLATAIAQLAVSRLFDEAEAAPPLGKRVLVACVDGELHDFPARLAADALELAGFDVLFLGASVPCESLVSMIAARQPDLVALSIAMTFNLPALRQAVAAVRAHAPGLPVIVGGHACAWMARVAAEVGADGSGCSADELVELVRSLLRVPS